MAEQRIGCVGRETKRVGNAGVTLEPQALPSFTARLKLMAAWSSVGKPALHDPWATWRRVSGSIASAQRFERLGSSSQRCRESAAALEGIAPIA